MPTDIFVGLDIGTSGARAIAISKAGNVLASGASAMSDHSADHRDPIGWLGAAKAALHQVCVNFERSKLRAICVDGTSGTMIPIDAKGTPLASGLMYNDPCTDKEMLARIADHAPATSAAHGATSGLAKLLRFQDLPDVAQVVHQADWIAGNLCGIYASDDNNALKTGYDPVTGCWPDWIEKTGARASLLPIVYTPGTPLAPLCAEVAKTFGLPEATQVLAGTTDGCAAFLATGAAEPGDGVTSLGTTLVLKLLSDKPIFDPESGLYSHHIMGLWLAGGASNTGGGVLLEHFTSEQIDALSGLIRPENPLNLGYYPLCHPGERFPIADPHLPPRMTPRPAKDEDFLQAMLEGIADVEALGYQKLLDLGGPKLASVRSVGGGALNATWTRIREGKLSVPLIRPDNTQAAYGAAVLARFGFSG